MKDGQAIIRVIINGVKYKYKIEVNELNRTLEPAEIFGGGFMPEFYIKGILLKEEIL